MSINTTYYKKTCLSLMLLLSSLYVFTQTVYTTTNSGVVNWASITWSSNGTGTPITYVVPSGLTATINANTSLPDTLRILGVLDFKSNVTLSMNTDGYVDLSTGGKVTGGSGNTYIIFGTLGTITGPYNGSGVYAGPSYATKSTGGTFVSGSAIPVTWHKIQGINNIETIQINWSTASESNNSHFEVQRANMDGQFYTLTTIKGSGTTQNVVYYTYMDINPLMGKSYYRIKQIDFDGHYDYSPIITQYHTNALVNRIQVFPTVLNSNNRVLTITNRTDDTEIYLSDNKGNKIPFTLDKEHIELAPFKQLPSGYYYLITASEESQKTFKILVQ